MGLLALAAASGLYVRLRFTHAPVDQLVLVAHLALGALCLVVFAGRTRPERASLGAAMATGAAAACGASAGWRTAHAWLALLACAVFVTGAPRRALIPGALALLALRAVWQVGGEPELLERAAAPMPAASARAWSADGKRIPVDAAGGSARCATCHAAIFAEWQRSMHRHAATNDHYAAVARLRGDARDCTSCHAPVAWLSGEASARDEGISCLSCHRVEALHHGTTGDGNLIVAPHQPYLSDALVRAKPDLHRADLMAPIVRKSELCAGCHKQSVVADAFFRLQTTYDEWKMSRFADPESASYRRCQDCHMPLVDGHRSHLFLGANTARPYLDGDRAMLDATQEFLRTGMRVRIEAKQDRSVTLKVTVENDTVGHKFPTGSVHAADVWVEVTVADARGRPVFRDGTYTFGARAVDQDGTWLHRGDLWNMAGQLNGLTVFPGTYNFRNFEFTPPPGSVHPLTAVAELRYRKYNQAFTSFVLTKLPPPDGAGYTGPWTPAAQLPVTVLARAETTIEERR